MADIGWELVTALLQIAVTAVVAAPLIWWGARRGDRPMFTRDAARLLAAGAGVFVAYNCLLAIPRVGFFADLSLNWQNKLLALVLLVLAVQLWPALTWREVGIRRPRRGWWIPVVSVFVVMFALVLLGEPPIASDAEDLAFQAIVPGLDEELAFRGILLVLLCRALVGRRSVGRVVMGWEVLITSLLFGLCHGLFVTSGWQVELDLGNVVLTGLGGLLLMWVRLRWDSLWPAVLTHNAINSGLVLAAAMVAA